MILFDKLAALGANTNEALQRMMGNENLYARMLKKLTEELGRLEVLPYLEDGNYELAFQNAHTLKGVTGNLGVTPLFNGYSEVVAALRAQDYDKAKSTMAALLPVQQQIVSCINENS